MCCGLFFLKLVELYPQGFPIYYHQQSDQFRSVRGELEWVTFRSFENNREFFYIGAPSENVVRKDFYIHEIPQEVLQDDIQEEMRLVMQRKAREQFELDRFVLKMYEEFRKRERDGTLSKFRLIWKVNENNSLRK